MILKVKKLREDAKLPEYAHHGDAGFDIYGMEHIEIKPGERKMIPTGLSFEVPEGHVMLVWDKSGLAKNFGLHNLAGVIDSGFRGEVNILIINHGSEVHVFEKHDKIAQALIQKVERVEFEEVDGLSETLRGGGGWGSTGKK
ncbi:dUTP diphosphatase [Patescibacteria group bacterium]|nr:dUTP diphosphatase [Patescibacteria group bacterium]